MCFEYLSQASQSDIYIDIRPFEIAEEALKSSKDQLSVPDDAPYIETLVILRKISEAMLSYNTFLMHGVALSASGVGVLITAPSGIGKTTHAKLWLDNVSDTKVINGDKPMIHIGQDEARAYGTPWCGKEHMGCNESVPLKVICFLERSTENKITCVRPARILPALLQQIYLPQDSIKMQKALQLFNELCSKVVFYRIQCNMEPEAALMVHDRLKADKIIP